jgi:pimeloyl-ACP methyl ester carboxylesterase
MPMPSARVGVDALGDRHEASLSAGPVEYFVAGSGPTLLLLHGLSIDATFWRKVVPSLSEHFRCLTPTLPLGGHRLPMRADADLSPPAIAALVAELLEKVGADEIIVVGNDTGGAIAQLLVTRHPQRVNALVLTPSDAFKHFFPWQFKSLQALAWVPGAAWQTGQLLRSAAFRRSAAAFGLLTKHGVPDEVTASWVAPVQSSRLIRRDLVKVLRGVSAKHTMAAAEALPMFDRPTLLLWATEDRVFPVSDARRLTELIPDARLELIEDSHTYIPEDQPDRLVEALVKFGADVSSR